MYSAFKSKYNTRVALFSARRWWIWVKASKARKCDLKQAVWAQCQRQYRLRTGPKKQSRESYPFLGGRWKSLLHGCKLCHATCPYKQGMGWFDGHKIPPEAVHGGCHGGLGSCTCPQPCSQSICGGGRTVDRKGRSRK